MSKINYQLIKTCIASAIVFASCSPLNSHAETPQCVSFGGGQVLATLQHNYTLPLPTQALLIVDTKPMKTIFLLGPVTCMVFETKIVTLANSQKYCVGQTFEFALEGKCTILAIKDGF